MFKYQLYLEETWEGNTLFVCLNGVLIANFTMKYYRSIQRYHTTLSDLKLFMDKSSAICYEIELDVELTTAMLRIDDVLGKFGIIEDLKLPPPDAKFAGKKNNNI